MEDIDRFLDSRHQGGTLDSSDAHFTISILKAREKLRLHQLPDPSFYILKIFQAAVAAGASEISIRLTRKSVFLWFETSTGPYDVPSTLEALSDVLKVADRGMRHLVTGLNASLAVQPVQVIWAEWSPEGERSFRIGEESVELLPPSRPPRNLPTPGFHCYRFQLDKPSPPALQGGANTQERSALLQRCGCAPARVLVDGKQILHTWDQIEYPRWLVPLSKPFLLAKRYVTGDSQKLAFPGQPASGYKSRAEGWVRWDREPIPFLIQHRDKNGNPTSATLGNRISCAGAYSLPLGLSGTNQITIVKDGVILQRVLVDSKPGSLAAVGAQAIVDGSDLSVDMSEFGVMSDQALHDVISEAAVQWESMAAECRKHLGMLKRVASESEKLREQTKRFSGCGLGCLGAVLIPLFLGFWDALQPFLALAGFVGGVIFPYVNDNTPDLDAILREEVEKRLEPQNGGDT